VDTPRAAKAQPQAGISHTFGLRIRSIVALPKGEGVILNNYPRQIKHDIDAFGRSVNNSIYGYKISSAMEAIRSGDLETFKALVAQDPSMTGRSLQVIHTVAVRRVGRQRQAQQYRDGATVDEAGAE
jgi:hypothetical protein